MNPFVRQLRRDAVELTDLQPQNVCGVSANVLGADENTREPGQRLMHGVAQLVPVIERAVIMHPPRSLMQLKIDPRAQKSSGVSHECRRP